MPTDVIIGPPGCGKTTELSRLVRERVERGETPLVCSLTRTAAREVAGRDLPVEKQQVGTLHAHALRALDYPDLHSQAVPAWNEKHPDWSLSGGVIDPDQPFEGAVGGDAPGQGDEVEALYHELRARMTSRDLWPGHVRAFADAWERWKGEVGVMDFTDLIDNARECPPPGDPRVIFADEAQDHSRLELELLRSWAQQAGDLVLVGDPRQALYTWRGAHPAMFSDDRITSRRRILSQSYRVPGEVHRVATAWARELSDWEALDYEPRPEKGSVSPLGATWRFPDQALELACDRLTAGDSVMLMTSCGYMLQPLLAALRSAGQPFANPWRVKRGDWNPLKGGRGVSMAERILSLIRPLDDVAASDDSFDFGHNTARRAWTTSDLNRWVGVLKAKGVLRRGAKKAIAELGKADSQVSQTLVGVVEIERWFEPEPAATLIAALAGVIDRDVLLDWWRAWLSEKKQAPATFPLRILRERGSQVLTDPPRLYVGTIHSFKGAEADTVIVFPDLSYSGYRCWLEDGEPRDSVVRAFYVAMTRARERLFLCQPASGSCSSVFECVN